MAKYSGKKFCTSHTTITDSSKKVIDRIKIFPEIKKISLGIIKKSRRSSSSLDAVKIKEIPAGLELVVSGQSNIQRIYLYISNSADKEKISNIIKMQS